MVLKLIVILSFVESRHLKVCACCVVPNVNKRQIYVGHFAGHKDNFHLRFSHE